MALEEKIEGLHKLGEYIKGYLQALDLPEYSDLQKAIEESYAENSWFTIENQKFALSQWASLFEKEKISDWLKKYPKAKESKKVGLILAGNIPLVGLHDVLSVILSGHHALIKLSSKDKRMLPFLLAKWEELSGETLEYEFVEKLEGFDAVIATGSNNTARYLEYYFKDYPRIVRKNRTSIALLEGSETKEEIELLGKDIFTYFGLGCRNVTYLLLPEGFKLDLLFENFLSNQEIINHHSYANNYDYNKAIYLLNQDVFWDNNFVMLKEDSKLFSPLSVVHFSYYSSLEEAKEFIKEKQEDIQCIVSRKDLLEDSVPFGEAQNPGLDTYADKVDTLEFLTNI